MLTVGFAGLGLFTILRRRGAFCGIAPLLVAGIASGVSRLLGALGHRREQENQHKQAQHVQRSRQALARGILRGLGAQQGLGDVKVPQEFLEGVGAQQMPQQDSGMTTASGLLGDLAGAIPTGPIPGMPGTSSAAADNEPAGPPGADIAGGGTPASPIGSSGKDIHDQYSGGPGSDDEEY